MAIQVRAFRPGYYHHSLGKARKRVGDEFQLVSPEHFSLRWMEPLNDEAEKVKEAAEAKFKADGKAVPPTPPSVALRKKKKEKAEAQAKPEKSEEKKASTGDAKVI